ncbi:hypothetical protein AAVH_29694 [Aphelenchoides avenae]|nr:hypothetical protein AAVH_29694 [Aphelenchus avenae]
MPDTVNQLVPYLRAAYCESVNIDLRWIQAMEREHHRAASGAVFGDLIVPKTFVNVLTVCAHKDNCVTGALRKFTSYL